ncbi:hypothetical protein KY336_00100 [Candidatus Woesearchaeota archaeon]|nr:hypothetical protein [Candidatus Woesearchaeota archaeon]
MKTAMLNNLSELKKCIRLGTEKKSSSLHDFNSTRAQYYKNLGKTKLNELLSQINDLPKSNQIMEITNLLLEIIDKYPDQHDQEELKSKIEKIEGLINSLEMKEKQKIRFDLPVIPASIKPELLSDMEEMQLCFDNGCYKAAVILSAKILEASLHRAYYEKTGKDLIETSPGIGLGKIVAKLSDQGIDLGPGTNEQIHLINKVRISSVHKQNTVFQPSKEQAHATILFTLDLLNKIFKKK